MEHENITQAQHKVQRKFAFKHVFLQSMQKIRRFIPFIFAIRGRVFDVFFFWFLVNLTSVFWNFIPRNHSVQNFNPTFLLGNPLNAQTSNGIPNNASSLANDTNGLMNLSSSDSAFVDSLMQLTDWKDYPAMYFIDSLRNPLQKTRFTAPFYLQIPDKTVRISNDPFNPFVHDTYLRKARGKFWFFGISIFIAIYIIYFRAAFGKQLELRLNSFLKSYHFEDLLREQAISSAAGSIHAYAIGILVFSQGVMLSLITSEYNRLNNFYIYLLLLVGVGGFFSILYFLQWIFTGSMELDGILNRQVQRQINVNLVFSFLSLPVFLYVYYNATEMQNQSISVGLWSVLIVWISVRLLFQVWGILRDNAISLTTILYLCALEIIPYLLVFKFLSSSI